jgi:3-hydroxyisobutyryl-CoA hydrolase
MDGALGTYLALTGAQLRGEDTLYAGIATHYVPSSRLNALQDRLCEMETDDPDVVNYAIEEFVGEPDKPFTLAPHRATIDACFQHGTVDAIVQALEQEGSEWSQQQIATLKQMSPTSLRITLEQLRLGQNRTFADCFRLEYHLVQRVLKHHDFSEGVQALLVDKRKFAHWNPATLQDISTEQVIQEYFKAPTEHELVLPSDAVHPMNRRYGLPTDQVIHKTIQEGRLAGNVTKPWKRDDLVEYFVQQWEGKRWTREKVTMTLDTKTTTDTNGYVTWIHQ